MKKVIEVYTQRSTCRALLPFLDLHMGVMETVAEMPSSSVQHSSGLSCVCHVELCPSRGKGKDGQQQEKEGVCRAGPGNFPSEENGIK